MPLKIQKLQDFTDARKSQIISWLGQKWLTTEFAFFFLCDKKPFLVQQGMNRRNEQIYFPRKSHKTLIDHQNSKAVYDDDSVGSYKVERDIKINANNWTFQQASALSYSVCVNERGNNSSSFSTHNGHQKFLESNLLDNCARAGILESKIDTKKYQMIDHLKQALQHK